MTFKQVKRITFLCLVCCVFPVMFTAYARWTLPIRPGDHVYDAQRHQEQILATAQLTEQAANAMQKIIHQLANITKAGGAISVQQANMQAGLDGFQQVLAGFAGMMNENISSDMVDGIFKNPSDAELKWYDYQQASQSVVFHFLENTCKDLLKLAYSFSITPQDADALRETMALNSNIPGNLAGKQVKHALLAAQIKQQIQSNRLDSAIAAVKTAEVKADMLTENRAERKARNMIVLSFDPFHPASEDRRNYQHKPSPGFMKFK